ncbi:hypothetical protein CMQ_5087 [Grosmannia clavigera kw1407]|uniref:Uncharacterized protein n=1 Tax=Grosmannia clavigera (strain kw1407 / UAMH 11150) TaxID=655863 RepID=F0XKE4_GROCL|nr:uncharacterized protein CMQ_5087 [Grosmannia clavigera kw1407]EFX02016.1 hypothetical protein CMQ_5087 [Grosmannia clavigera kw1407]
MSELQTIVSIWQLIAEVTENVEGLKKLDSASRSLARRVSNEVTMYGQFFCKLTLVSNSSSSDECLWKNIEARLGDKTARLLASNFQSMQKTLSKLKNDITSTNLETAVLNKLGPSVADTRKGTGTSRTTIQKRLDKLSTINKNFASYMANPWIPLPHLLGAEQRKTKPTPKPNVRTPETSIAASNPSAEGAEGDMHGCPPTQDQTSVSEMIDTRELKTHRRPGTSETENRSFLQLLDDIKSKVPLTSLQDLIRPGRRKLTRGRRLDLAFRFCAFVLRLSTTPWADDFREWVNWDINFGHLDGEAHCGQHPGRDFYSLQVSVDKSTDSMSSKKTQSQQPMLTKIGISLIELAFGQSLGEIRQSTPGLLVEKDLQENFQAVDKHLLDILTAKQLLSSRRIRDEIGVGFEDAVGACVYRQFQEFRSLAIKELNMAQESFLEDAKYAILAPLYREIIKYSQHECDGNHFDTLGPGDITGNPEIRTIAVAVASIAMTAAVVLLLEAYGFVQRFGLVLPGQLGGEANAAANAAASGANSLAPRPLRRSPRNHTPA